MVFFQLINAIDRNLIPVGGFYLVGATLPLKTNSGFKSIEHVLFNLCIQPFESQCFLGCALISMKWHLISGNERGSNAIIFMTKLQTVQTF